MPSVEGDPGELFRPRGRRMVRVYWWTLPWVPTAGRWSHRRHRGRDRRHVVAMTCSHRGRDTTDSMDLNGSHKFSANRQVVWDALHNAAVLQGCVPGAQQMSWQGDSAIAAVVNVGVGPIKGTFNGTIQVAENSAPSRIRLVLNRSGSHGSVNAQAVIDLADDGAGTVLSYQGNAQLTGQVAMADNMLGKQAADMALGSFFKCLSSKIGG